MRVAFVETGRIDQFSPLAWTRPVFELLCGTRSVRQRFLDSLKPAAWGAITREHVAEVYQAEQPESQVNNAEWLSDGKTLLIDGCWLGDPQAILEKLADDVVIYAHGRPVACWDNGPISADSLESLRSSFGQTENTTRVDLGERAGLWLNYPWELIKHNGKAIHLDYFMLEREATEAIAWQRPESGITAGSDADLIRIHPTAVLEPFVSIDASSGPVIVDEGAHIQSFTRLEGPCYIGKKSQLFRANLRGETSVGPVCRVGGEVEASILHGYANKYHDGFLGHGYVCPWVNLGALTTNSDLKNNYSNVKLAVGTEFLDSGEKKVGCFIGDHAKTAIGTLFNTGSSVGVMAMVLPAGRLCPKHIPSFARYWQGSLDDALDFESACETAATVMGRRDQEFTAAHRRMFASIRDLTAAERKAALQRSGAN